MTSFLIQLSSLFVALHLLLWLPSLCYGSDFVPNEECTLEERFYEHEYGCRCLTGSLENCGSSESHTRAIECNPPSKLARFPVSKVTNVNITCIELRNGGFTSLTRQDLSQFPNLKGLHIRDSKSLESVSEDLFADTRELEYITLTNCRIRKLPRLTGLSCLAGIDVTNNEIEEIKAGDFDGINRLITFYAGGNNIKELKGEVFTDHCSLSELRLHDNPIRVVENVAIENTSIVELDLSRTEIDSVPITLSLRKWLTRLYLEGTKRLIEFNPFSPPPNAPYNQTFPFLKTVSFNYHAHCCRMRKHFYLEDPIVQNRRVGRSLTLNNENHQSGFVSGKSVALEHVRRVRQASNPPLLHRCVNLTSLQCVDSSNAALDNVTVSAEEFCNSTDICFPCLTNVCLPGSCDPNSTTSSGSGIGGLAFASEIVCIMVTPQPAPTMTVVSTTITQVNRTVCSSIGVVPSPTPTTSPPSGPCDNPTLDFICDSANFETYCACFRAEGSREHGNCVACLDDSDFCDDTSLDCTPYPRVCDCPRRRKRRLPAANRFLETLLPHQVKKRNTMPSSSGPGQICTVSEVDAVCVTTVTIPLVTPTMTPLSSVNTIISRDSNETEWFYPDQSNTDLRCRERIDNVATSEGPTILTTTAGDSMTDSVANRPLCDREECGNPLPFEIAVRSLNFTNCFPVPNELNPCDDLLEDNHALRVFIWIVIFLALVGNALVISVFLGYSVIIRRTRQDLFVSHFFYFNLAAADSLMGVYLITIAIEDLVTLNNFSAYDIRWRTGHGCGFAGFCAILSTMVSVYVLVVISVERAYTIVRVMHRKKITKPIAMVIMAVGWIIGVIVAMLPLVGVSDYGFVAICLPFDVTTPINTSYVVFLLVVTGLAFIIVAVSYIIIFYQVFCSRKRHVQRHSSKAWKQEVKAAFRMSLLVATNFVCWLPIALVGIGSAFGYNLNVDLTFAKWAMVFVFPINACLNPFLYSFTTKLFRDNFIILISKCGVFQNKARKVRNARIGITPSITSKDSSSQVPAPRKRGTIIERLRLLSLSAQGSSTDLSERRDSGSLVVDENVQYLRQNRRSSEFSSASSDLLLANTSRRDSTFSGNSLEENITFSNPGYRANSPVNRSSAEVTVVVEPVKTVQVSRPKISASSLGVVPEEGEISVSPEDTLNINGGYRDEDNSEPPSSTSPTSEVILRRNGVASQVCTQHQIDANKGGGASDSKRDSGNSGSCSDSPSIDGELSEFDSESNNSGTNSTTARQPTTTTVDGGGVELTFIDEVEESPSASKSEVQSEVIEFD